MNTDVLLDDLLQASIATKTFLLITGACLLYIVGTQVVSATRLASGLLAHLAPSRATPLSALPLQDSVADRPTHRQKPGKSIKQLQKEARRAAAITGKDQLVPDTPYYLGALKGHGDAVVSIDIDACNGLVMTACSDEVVRVYNMKGDFGTATPSMFRVPLKSAPVGAVFWGGPTQVAALTEGLGLVANVEMYSLRSSRQQPDMRVSAARLHGDTAAVAITGTCSSATGPPLLASMTRRGEVALVGASGTLLARFDPAGIENNSVALPLSILRFLSTQTSTTIAMSGNGKFIAVATWGSDLKIWELQFARDQTFTACHKCMHLQGHTSGVTSVAFNDDGTRVATSSKDRSFRIWNINVRYAQQEDPKCVVRARQSAEPYTLLSWCPNGTIVGVVGSSIDFISPKSGHVVEQVLNAHNRKILCLSCASASVTVGGQRGCVAVTGGADGKARLWRVPRLP